MKNNIKETILKNAFSLFLEQGYEKTTTRQIATASQLERGHLYYYYRKKDDILFDIYSNFIKAINDFVHNHYGDLHDDIMLMTITNILYYDIVFLDERFCSLLNSILSHNHLVQLKVEKTYEMYENNSSYDDTILKEITCMMIGAESQLMLQVIEGGLNLTYSDVGQKVVELSLLLLKGNKEEAKKTYSEAKNYVDKLSKKEFYYFLCQNSEWAKVYKK